MTVEGIVCETPGGEQLRVREVSCCIMLRQGPSRQQLSLDLSVVWVPDEHRTRARAQAELLRLKCSWVYLRA